MATKTFHSSTITLLDRTDERKLEIYISSNHPTVQIYNSNTREYTPDWGTTNLTLSADIYLDSTEITDKATIKWYRQSINDTEETEISSTVITENVLIGSTMVITYICRVEYQGLTAFSKITFTRVDTGLNGSDGTSINIKGTATSVTAIPDTNYYTITYDGSDVSTAELSDSYMYNGNLYTCIDSRDGVDYFINVGRIQGPKGEDAKSIILTGDAQVFKISKTNVYTPSTITITAQAINTSISAWSYSINGGQTFLSATPTGVIRNGNVVTVTGSSLISNSLVIKASDGQYSDIFTIYKAFDGTDGIKGTDGQAASTVFLTNENISFSANANGQIALTSFNTNVVAYSGTTKVTPTIGTIAGLPSGMTVATPITTANEQILTFSIANNSTLGSTSSNSGTITIPIISPVSTNLILSWSKINTGATGVSIASTTVSYGVSDSASTRPNDDSWQSTIPVVEDGKYLWTRTVIAYTDPTMIDTVTYTYSKQGIKGDTLPSSDSIVSSGADGEWTIRKWSSGISECWRKISGTITKYSTWNGMYGYQGSAQWPSGLFIAMPNVQYQVYIGSGFAMPAGGATSTTTLFVWYALSSENTDNVDYVVDVYAIGRWK